MVMITLYEKQKKRHRCTEQILHSVGEGEGGMFRENIIETCILSRVKQITSTGWDARDKCSGLVRWEDTEGSGGEAGGRGTWRGIHVNPWLTHVHV